MKKFITFAALGLTLIVSSICNAHSVNQIVHTTVNEAGKDCPSVTKVKTLSTTETGTPIIAGSCFNGTGHVLKIMLYDTLD